MKELPIIQSLWIGEKLSVMERLCISSFLKNGHLFHLYVYDKVLEIPKGTVVKDANEIISSDMIFKYKKHNSYAGFSNLFRYKLLLEKGGYWVDTDVVCLTAWTDEREYIFASEREKPVLANDIYDHNLTKVANCIIKAPIGSKIMKHCYKVSVSKDHHKLNWGDTGPKLVTEAVKLFDMESYIAAPEEYCPIDWWNWNQFIDGSVENTLSAESKAVHLWNEMWRRNKVDKEAQFEKNSLYEYFKKIYLNNIYDEKRPIYQIKKNLLLNQNDINTIRDSAIALEKTNLILAHDLMSIAHKARPDGKFIIKKLKRYKQQLSKNIEF